MKDHSIDVFIWLSSVVKLVDNIKKKKEELWLDPMTNPRYKRKIKKKPNSCKKGPLLNDSGPISDG